MLKHYKNYYWDEGIPKGASPINPEAEDGINYKIVSDPYYKWISIEKYLKNTFQTIVYDSHLFDFRTLRPTNQIAWQKIPLTETCSHIKNQDDRTILFEHYSFIGNRCWKCSIISSHGIPVSTQRVFWKALGDPVDGVALFDQEARPVMYKLYTVDSESSEFSDLTEEKWKMQYEDLSQWPKSPTFAS